MAQPSKQRSRRRAAARPGRGNYDRSRTKEERHAERHDRLLRAAAVVFVEDGYSSATLGKIVARAGVWRRTFYDHFDDLRDCLVAVHDHAVAVFSDLGAEMHGVTDPIERLHKGIVGYLTTIGNNGALAQVLTRDVLGLGREHVLRQDAVYTRFAMIIVEGVAEARARGLVSRRPDELTAYALVGAIETVALRYVDRGETDRILDAAPTLVELVLRAFR